MFNVYSWIYNKHCYYPGRVLVIAKSIEEARSIANKKLNEMKCDPLKDSDKPYSISPTDNFVDICFGKD